MSKDVIPWIKVADIVFITTLCFIFGYILAFILDVCSETVYGSHYSTKSTWKLSLEVLTQVIALALGAYVARNWIQRIPFPLDGLYGFEHLRVKEVASAGWLTTFGTIFFYDLQNKLHFLRQRSFPLQRKGINVSGL